MPFPYLDENERLAFPSIDQADSEGVLAWGGNLSPGMLLSAYEQGIFPWYSDNQPILWWSPDPRFVLLPGDFHVPHSLERVLKKNTFRFSCDTRFYEVISGCRESPREGQDGTWITPDMREAYMKLNTLGYAHSFEVWEGETLAGGLYGVSIGACFFGESMFTRVPNASKAGFVIAYEFLMSAGIDLVDSQVFTPHMKRFGAHHISRAGYLRELNMRREKTTQKGCWTEDFALFIEKRDQLMSLRKKSSDSICE